MKAIYTLYITPDNFKKYCGFNSIDDMISSLLLSANLAAKQFEKVEIYTTSFGYQFLNEFPGQTIICLDNISFPKVHWAYPKVYVYSLQKEPFIHIDLDAFLWDKLPTDLLDNDFIFQQKESLGSFFKYYDYPIKLAIENGIMPGFIKEPFNYAFNTALFGCTSSKLLPIIAYYKFLVDSFINECQLKNRLHQDDSIVFEQLFIARILQTSSVIKVGTILNEDFSLKYANCTFTHLLAESKKSTKNLDGVKFKLNQLFPTAKKINYGNHF